MTWNTLLHGEEGEDGQREWNGNHKFAWLICRQTHTQTIKTQRDDFPFIQKFTTNRHVPHIKRPKYRRRMRTFRAYTVRYLFRWNGFGHQFSIYDWESRGGGKRRKWRIDTFQHPHWIAYLTFIRLKEESILMCTLVLDLHWDVIPFTRKYTHTCGRMERRQLELKEQRTIWQPCKGTQSPWP